MTTPMRPANTAAPSANTAAPPMNTPATPVNAAPNRAKSPIDIARYAGEFSSLQFLAPETGILELVIANKGRLNAATEAMHRDLASVWRAIDMDDAVRAVMVRGEGSNFSSGGDFDMIERMIEDEATLIRVWKEASDLVYNLINCSKPVVSAFAAAPWERASPSPYWRMCPSPRTMREFSTATRARRCGGRSCRHHLAAALRPGEGAVPPVDE